MSGQPCFGAQAAMATNLSSALYRPVACTRDGELGPSAIEAIPRERVALKAIWKNVTSVRCSANCEECS